MFNLLKSSPSSPSLGRDARRESRHPAIATVTLQCRELGSVEACLLDLSAHGSRLRAAREFTRDAPVSLAIEGMPLLDARVIWSRGHESGICFDRPLHEAVLDHLLARSGAMRV